MYRTVEHDQKIEHIAADRGCTNARVLRKATDALANDATVPTVAPTRAAATATAVRR